MDSTPNLIPAKDLAARATRRYPNDSDEYRKARIALLAEEIELRRHITRVAARRRALPLGGNATDYRFRDEQGKELGLADLFGRHETLVTYFWMYGPQRERPCSDVHRVPRRARRAVGRPAAARRLRDPRPLPGRAAARIRARTRLAQPAVLRDDRRRLRARLPRPGRRRQRMGLARRLGAQGPRRVPLLGRGDHQEMADPGQDPHLAPEPVPICDVLDLTPGGRGTDWYPKLSYGD